jgi:hypothetical protein
MRRRKLHAIEARATIKMAAFNVHRRAATWTKNKPVFEFEAACRSSSSSICGDDGMQWPGYIASIAGSRLGKRRSSGPNTPRM